MLAKGNPSPTLHVSMLVSKTFASYSFLYESLFKFKEMVIKILLVSRLDVNGKLRKDFPFELLKATKSSFSMNFGLNLNSVE